MNKKTILLTGATGFLGSHLLEKLCSLGIYEVIITVRDTSDLTRIKHLITKTKIYNLSISPIELIFQENKVDIIVHTAVQYGREDTSCIKILETNLMFPITLLELCQKYNVKLFVNTDSYFNKENLAYSSLLHYSLSKKSLRIWLKYFSKKIKIINIVLEHIFGPFDSRSKFVEHAIRQIAIENVTSIDLTDGQQKRDFIYVKDVVDAYIKILDCMSEYFKYREYNVGLGNSISIKYFVTQIKEISKSHTQLNFGAIPYREDEIMNSTADNSSLINIGWVPNYTIEDALHEIVALYKK